jgi:predicted nuclease of predicted toxin-antitoxin system
MIADPVLATDDRATRKTKRLAAWGGLATTVAKDAALTMRNTDWLKSLDSDAKTAIVSATGIKDATDTQVSTAMTAEAKTRTLTTMPPLLSATPIKTGTEPKVVVIDGDKP